MVPTVEPTVVSDGSIVSSEFTSSAGRENFANPKSSSLACASPVTKMFAV